MHLLVPDTAHSDASNPCNCEITPFNSFTVQATDFFLAAPVDFGFLVACRPGPGQVCLQLELRVANFAFYAGALTVHRRLDGWEGSLCIYNESCITAAIAA